jgi:hypothetical protein
MKSYHDKDERLTKEGVDLLNEIATLIEPIFKRENLMGYRIREIAYIIRGAIRDEELSQLLDNERKKNNERTSN